MKRASYFAAVIIGLTLLVACATPQKQFERGNYDEAIRLAVDQLRERKVKEKDVITLVEAFNYVNQREAVRLERMKAERNPEKWNAIFDLAGQIRHRQDLVRPLLAFNDEKYYGRLSALQFTEGLDATIAEAREGAAAFLYDRAKSRLVSAQTGNRQLARAAYDDFNAIKRYYNNYRDAERLAQEAYATGINHVYVKVENDSRAYLPADFERVLESVFVRDLNTQWIKYHTYKDENLRYDYTIVARMTRINLSPGSERRDHHIEEAKVEDGFEYVLDERGNVKKDSLGNDIRVPRYKWVRADVFEVRQLKEAQVFGYIEYFDNRTNERILSRPVESNAVFSNLAVRFEGDRRALTAETRNRLGGSPQPFPSDEALLLTAAERLKNVTKSMIDNNNHIVSR